MREETEELKEQERAAILACQKGDMEAFEVLYQRYHRGLYGYLLSMLRSPHAAEDLTQDIFVKLFRQIGSYNFQAPFSHWLFRLARNLAIDHIRREKVRFSTSLDKEVDGDYPLQERLAGKSVPADTQILKNERASVVVKAVQELPEDFKAVVVMREWEDLAYEEISQRLDLSVGTVKSRLFRARALLAKKLKNWEKE
ncbi:MAG: sigma-70 family RNA polymerase sigma factor [candidate division FCPU426 bacterium]